MERVDRGNAQQVARELRLNDAVRKEVYGLSIPTLKRIDGLRKEAGYELPQEACTVEELLLAGERIGRFALPHSQLGFPAERIELAADFCTDDEPDNDFRLMFTPTIVLKNTGERVKLESVSVDVYFRSPYDLNETELNDALLNAEDEPVPHAERIVAKGFERELKDYAISSATLDRSDEERGFLTMLFILERKPLESEQPPDKG